MPEISLKKIKIRDAAGNETLYDLAINISQVKTDDGEPLAIASEEEVEITDENSGQS